jgi:hypothetical protein
MVAVQIVQQVQPLRSACPDQGRRDQTLALILPRVAGEETGGGLNGLNELNRLDTKTY